MGDYIRARSPQHKQERMDAIMDAAESLYRTLPYHEINMGLIAKELGWSRSNLYKYAATQEEIFLALHMRAQRAYVDALVKALKDSPMDNTVFAQKWAKVTAKHTDFLRYQDILIAIIESNSSFEKLVEFKGAFGDIVGPVIEVLRRQTGMESLQDAVDLYLRLVYQASGLHNHFNCSKRTADAMKAAGMPLFKGTFQESYSDFVEMCLEWV